MMYRYLGGRFLGRLIGLAALSVGAAIPLSQGAAIAAVDPTPAMFDCSDGIWQHLRMDENHDNLFAKLGADSAAPGDTVPFTLTWEWRDWRPGATVTVRTCLDVDASPDGAATASFDALGGAPADAKVTHPVDQPTATVMKGPEIRPAVVMPFTFVVPANAPPGAEVCMRAAVLPDAVEHRNSPPVFDISDTVCVQVVAPTSTTVPPPPVPEAPPPPAPETVATNATPVPQPPQPEAEVLGQSVLPRTGVPAPVLLLAAGLLVMAGAIAIWRRPKPLVVFGTLEPRKGRRY